MQTKLNEVRNKLQAYGQEHLLAFWPSLSDDSREKLLQQIDSIDFDLLQQLSGKAGKKEKPDSIEPISAEKWTEFDKSRQAELEQLGWSLLKQGKAAVLVVAGGQGTRLGHPGPKGTFDIGLPSRKSLFQLQAERLINLSGKAQKNIPWYIMTSPENDAETRSFFAEHHYFGYDENSIYFFEQGVFPAIDDKGKVLLARKDEIVMAPSGNGDCFPALKRNGILDQMKQEGVEWLFYYNVDNAIVRIADPAFIGYAAASGLQSASKVVRKSHARERVGILCMQNGRPAVAEYSDIPEELMLAADDKGQWLFPYANISMHLFHVNFVEKAAAYPMPFHAANKKIRTVDAKGDKVVPEQPNGYKFEKFIFDCFPLMERMALLEVEREDEFAPVKNKEGQDSPDTAREMLYHLHRKWLLAAGVSRELIEHQPVEISPLLSYAGEGLDSEVIRSILASRVV
ncbi:UTP--glucose-1-phosphate uridylyltransferase [Paenibacillus senegalensis]|uniref:UTP--glucose-1-phosphate uridylyltransferase n=1 Tax=Paenibacillus senegalensis TaxID=1465766 RepID=UPI0002886533|nr:UDPGP type 1 family protein [Paenibacillus senegalensis]